MSPRCSCGREIVQEFHRLGCLDCGAACCPACAVQLESATYCEACAGALLGTRAIRSGDVFDFQ